MAREKGELMNIRLRKPSPAMVVACLALFVALSGVGTAAVVVLKKNQVKSIHIGQGQVKRSDLGANAVNSAKVLDGSLLALDFALGQLPSGPRGLQGEAGRSALEPLRSGETIRGVIGGVFKVDSEGTFTVFEAFPIPAPVAVAGDSVDVNGDDETGGRCTGTASAPTAPPGVVCMYAASTPIDARTITGQGAPTPVAGSPYGFALDVYADNAGPITVRFAWAYTAP